MTQTEAFRYYTTDNSIIKTLYCKFSAFDAPQYLVTVQGEFEDSEKKVTFTKTVVSIGTEDDAIKDAFLLMMETIEELETDGTPINNVESLKNFLSSNITQN